MGYITSGILTLFAAAAWVFYSPWYSFIGIIGFPLGAWLIFKGRQYMMLEYMLKRIFNLLS